MARIEFARKVASDIERIFDHLVQHDPLNASARIQELIQAIAILKQSPWIGCIVKGGKRELIVGRGAHGYLVLYRYDQGTNTVFVLAIRNQRERRYA